MYTFSMIFSFGLFIYTLLWFLLHAVVRIGSYLKDGKAFSLTPHLFIMTGVSIVFFGTVICYLQR